MIRKPPSCDGCPAKEVGRGYVPGHGPRDATYAYIGQGPGEQEAHAGQPFVGKAGFKAKDQLARASINPHRVWFDNVVRCWLPANRAPTKKERAFCGKVHLWPTLHTLRPTVIITAGVPAASELLGEEVGERIVGNIIKKEYHGPE